MFNCIIVDDEQYSVDAISKHLDQVPNINVIGAFTNPYLALQTVSNIGLDLLILDIDMPELSGIELSKILRAKTKKLLFITAHTEYALEAFEVAADAYLLKPFSFEKLYNTISRLLIFDNIETPAGNAIDDHFLVKNKQEDLRIIKVKFDEVVAFESNHNYVKIYTSHGKIISAYLTNKDILALIKNRQEFCQFHRSFIVSTNHIDYIDGLLIKMKNNLAINVGEHYKDNFNAYIRNKLIKTTRTKK